MLLDRGRARTVSHTAWTAARRHEHRAEVLALARLLGRRKLGRAVYVGDGYGRFAEVLDRRAGQVTVAAAGPLPVEDASADLVVLVTVLGRVADPAEILAEAAR